MHRRYFSSRSNSTPSTPKPDPFFKKKSFDMNDSIRNYFHMKNNQINWHKEVQLDHKIEKWKQENLYQFFTPDNQKHDRIQLLVRKSFDGIKIFCYNIGTINYDSTECVILFGKVLIKKEYFSVNIIVKETLRNLYFFPKRNEAIYRVKREVIELMSKVEGNVRFKVTKKKYAFEMDLDYR